MFAGPVERQSILNSGNRELVFVLLLMGFIFVLACAVMIGFWRIYRREQKKK
jgi:heme/copper-type cytochrome/quinol oxidase subunit 2